ncbi:MAG: hypothetical protein WAO95_07600 [Burkholderiales bacterium]
MRKSLLAALAALMLGGCAVGRMDMVGSFEVSGSCVFRLRFEIIQNGSVVASATFRNELGTDFRDGNVNYDSPLRIHIEILDSNAACPPSLRAPNQHYYWPSPNLVGTLKQQPNRRYQVDLKAFQAVIRPGSVSVR